MIAFLKILNAKKQLNSQKKQLFSKFLKNLNKHS